MKIVGNLLMIIGLCMITAGVGLTIFSASVKSAAKNQMKENCKSFAIDSVDYHAAGRDNTLQVSPYWKCHLKGTNVWVRVNENREVGDSLVMVVKY
jgi:hypothetical protein